MDIEVTYATEFGSSSTTMKIDELTSWIKRYNFKILSIKEQQQSYSEEEVFKIVEQAIKDYNNKQLHLFDGSFSNPIYTNLKKWFNQFKNK